MKRALLFAAILAAGFVASSAHALPRLERRPIGWHTSIADGSANPAYSLGDSFFVTRGTGIENSAQQVDTTQTIDLQKWIMPGPVYTTAVASDSVAWLRVALVPDGTSPTVAGDSIHVQFQVSDDNKNWTSVVWTGPKISPNFASMGARAVLETGTSNSFETVIRQIIGGATESIFDPLGTGAPTDKQVYGFPYGRFLISGDHTGKFRLEVTGFVPE